MKYFTEVLIIGGGAAGIFSAINCARQNSSIKVTLIEKSSKLLSKVKISGGGRCNVTTSCFNPKLLVQNYPRGEKALFSAFSEFGPKDTVSWFESRGVKLKAEEDGRIFPVSNNSQTIIDCLLNEAKKYKVEIIQEKLLKKILKKENGFECFFNDESIISCNKILIATGGNPNADSYQWIAKLGHKIEKPVPSLFTFNLIDKEITKLMGISLENVSIKITGTKLISSGPFLITHWGFSGPSVLKLSALSARHLSELNYKYSLLVNWIPSYSEDALRDFLQEFRSENGSKIISSKLPFDLPRRLWDYLLEKSDVDVQQRWSELPRKNQNKLINNLICDQYMANGKTTFKEEFVTCGGVSLNDVDLKTMQSKNCKGLFFAGEILDIDGITGGFNFQAAWTTGWIAARSMAEK